MRDHRAGLYEKVVKRCLDIICALTAILLFWWVYTILALLVRIKLGSPVIFRQERVGKNEKEFMLYKFRSMTDERDERDELLPDSERLTKFGKLLRASSLDELPEFFNILKGEMSLIGPRPLPTEYKEYYNDLERHRHDVLPGLSGWAQVNGRTAIGWEERFCFDVDYVNRISFGLDMKIIFLTIKKVFEHADIVEAGNQGDFSDFRKKQWSQADEVRNR